MTIAVLMTACGNDGGSAFDRAARKKMSAPKPHHSGPAPTPVRIHKGQAKVSVSGGFNRRFVLPPGPGSVYAPPPGQIALNWLDRHGNALIIRGDSFRGTRKSSRDLALSLVLQAGQPFVFAAQADQCTVTLAKLRAKSLSGTFRCSKISGTNKTITAHGSFVGHR